MKFVTNESERVLAMAFDSDEVVAPLALAILAVKAEARKFWSITATVGIQYRHHEMFYDWTEMSSADGMVTFSKSVGLRKRSV